MSVYYVVTMENREKMSSDFDSVEKSAHFYPDGFELDSKYHSNKVIAMFQKYEKKCKNKYNRLWERFEVCKFDTGRVQNFDAWMIQDYDGITYRIAPIDGMGQECTREEFYDYLKGEFSNE